MTISTTRNDTPGRGPHRTDTLSLVFGLIFLGFAGAWAADHFLGLHWNVDWELPHLGWILAGALVLVGLLGILASIRRDKDDPGAPMAMPTRPVDTLTPPMAMPTRPVDTPTPPTDATTEPLDPVRGTDRPE